jgi:YHS domain-containing protein
MEARKRGSTTGPRPGTLAAAVTARAQPREYVGTTALWVISAILLTDCQQHSSQAAPSSESRSKQQPDATLKAPGEAQLGDRTTCTIHPEHELTVTAATPKVEYKGKVYHFCCPVCANKFAERPQEYVKR